MNMSLSQLQKKYEGTRKQYELASQSSREAIEQAIETETIRSLKLQNYRVNQIHKNQQNIEAKQRRNNELLSEIRRSQGIWTGLYEELNRSLKIAGDLCNYAEYIENEMKELDGQLDTCTFNCLDEQGVQFVRQKCKDQGECENQEHLSIKQDKNIQATAMLSE